MLERFLVRRYSDNEIINLYGEKKIKVITGSAGTGFAEDTLCIHKGMPPGTKNRLLLQIQFAFKNYNNQNDVAEKSSLGMIINKNN